MSNQGWAVIGLVALVMVLLSLWADVRDLRYDRVLILHGEWWRLVTGHWVHFDRHHLLLNLAGLALVAALFPTEYSARAWTVIVLASMVAIDLGFLSLRPSLAWYVGASGVLHGLIAAGAIQWWRQQPRWLASALTLILVTKLIWEQTHGALPLSGGMPVVVDAHLFGAFGGGCAGVMLAVAERRQARAAPTTRL